MVGAVVVVVVVVVGVVVVVVGSVVVVASVTVTVSNGVIDAAGVNVGPLVPPGGLMIVLPGEQSK